jgi:3-phenylpropionate/trans-cinnamate dioxygenase ferredoxin reductase component
VTALDAQARIATLSSKEEIQFEKALIATGANVRRLSVDGCELEQIHYLRTLGNSDAIRAGAEDAEEVVLIGGSFIGCEVAASLTALGKSCTIATVEQAPLEMTFGARAGQFFREQLESVGVKIHGGEALERFEGDSSVRNVIMQSGLELAADMAVVGVGVIPDVLLAQKAGLQIGERGGVRCSSRLETSVPGIFAAGDICEYESVVHGGAHVRIEHWDVAFNHGKTAALNMLGRDQPHDVVPYFFSDLSDWASLEYVGPALTWEQEVVRGSIDDGQFSIFYLHDGRVAGALSVGRSDDLDHARRLLISRTDVSDRVNDLQDASIGLASI